MLGAHDAKTSHCCWVAVTTWMVRGRRYLRTAASATRLMHVGFTATPAPRQALPWVSENSRWVAATLRRNPLTQGCTGPGGPRCCQRHSLAEREDLIPDLGAQYICPGALWKSLQHRPAVRTGRLPMHRSLTTSRSESTMPRRCSGSQSRMPPYSAT
jgi:hypothetical protein